MDPDRRRVLRSVVAAGTLGIAGCFSGDSGTPETDGGTPTPTDTATPTSTERPTPTYTTIPGVRTDVPSFFSFGVESPEATTGSTVTVSGTFRNPYRFEVVDVEITLDMPGDAWTVTPEESTFDAVPAGAERTIEWQVSVPDVDPGEYMLVAVTIVQGPRNDQTIRTDVVRVQVTGG